MKHAPLLLVSLLVLEPCIRGQSKWLQGDEVLNYRVQWPSGLELGEAQLQARRIKTAAGTEEKWDLLFTVDAAVPGFAVKDRYRSLARPDFCSLEYEKESVHGKRIVNEVTAFDQQNGTAVRETRGGGRSELRIPTCAKDALAFLFFTRRELAQGRLPPPQAVFFGSPYQVSLEYGGRQRLSIGGDEVDADRLTVSVKGPASAVSFEVFISHDEARRLVLARVPLPTGLFSLELVP